MKFMLVALCSVSFFFGSPISRAASVNAGVPDTEDGSVTINLITANALITVLTSSMDGAQANGGLGTGSGGTGSATMTLDTDTGEFQWFIVWQDLEGTVSNAHFHGPAAPGMNAGVQVGIDFMSNPSIGSAILNDNQINDLLAGLWYINIHSTTSPGGEIRGQVLVAGADIDNDGVPDSMDNCSEVANADQRDTDGDGFGNRCDADLNNDLSINFIDLGLLKSVFFSADPDADFDGSGAVNFVDLGIMKATFFGAPGPGAVQTVTYTDDVQPIFFNKCAPCHTGLSLGGHDLGTTYTDAFLPAANPVCAGLNKGQCTIVRIQSGQMPFGGNCTGDPAQDAGNAACLTQAEQDTVQAWIDAGLPE